MRIEKGACVIVTACEPREKFWGIIDEISSAGVCLRGIDLNSYDELVRMLTRSEEGIFPATVFFPLRRIERITLDETTGYLPSLKSQFELRTGLALEAFLGPS